MYVKNNPTQQNVQTYFEKKIKLKNIHRPWIKIPKTNKHSLQKNPKINKRSPGKKYKIHKVGLRLFRTEYVMNK